jgi:16S rRNA processing protein RimM
MTLGMANVYLGRLVKAFGIRGELKLDPAEDFWEDALSSKLLVLRRETDSGTDERGISLEAWRPHGKGYVVGVKGVSDRNEAESMIGSDVFIEGDEIDVALPEKRRPFQVVGITVKTVDGRLLGEVTEVVFSPAHDVYEIQGPAGTFMVPAVGEYIVSIDDAHKEMTIRTIPGLVGEDSDT